VDGDRIYGDGVNIAARVEGLAEGGCICTSGTVYEQIKNKLALGYESLGEHTVKNIAEPVRVYRINLQKPDTKPLELPDKPSIAVLPFKNLSGDPEQEYFSDGITEDIITAVSRIRQFFVIARNSTFAYKGTSPDVRRVAKDLGVRYVLEGSVRKAASRVRISAQLIEGTTGNHLWAERYDRDLEDVFAVQDEITQTVVGTIEPRLAKAERERAKRKRPEDLDSWDLYQRGMYLVQKRTKEDCDEAQPLFERAIELTPTFAVAYSGLALSHIFLVTHRLNDSLEDHREKALLAARRAVELDDEDALARAVLGVVHHGRRDPNEALFELQAAVDLNPSSAFAHLYLGTVLVLGFGKAEEAITHINLAIRLSPHDPSLGVMISRTAYARLLLGDYEQAVEYARKALRYPEVQFWVNALLVSALAHLGRDEESKHALAELLRRRPNFTCSFYKENAPAASPDLVASVVEGLRKAGLPE
jgi:TolB-like protein